MATHDPSVPITIEVALTCWWCHSGFANNRPHIVWHVNDVFADIPNYRCFHRTCYHVVSELRLSLQDLGDGLQGLAA